jgi:hypothetical protein
LTHLEEVGQIAWCPNGKLLAASGTHRYRAPGKRNAEGDWVEAGERFDAGVWVVDLASGSEKLLHHEYTGDGDVGAFLGTHWSPDSRSLAMLNYGCGPEGDEKPSVTLVEVTTGRLHRLGSSGSGLPDWLAAKRPGRGRQPADDRAIIDLDTGEPSGA